MDASGIVVGGHPLGEPLDRFVDEAVGLLDAMTDGGRGVALLWPFTTARYFLPFRPIPVAPIGAAIFSAYGAQVTAIEVAMFCPLWLWAIRPARR